MSDPTNPHPNIVLRPPKHRVERRAMGWWALQSAVLTLPLLAAAIVAQTLWGAEQSWPVMAIIVMAVLTVIGLVVEPLWRYRVHRWETTSPVSVDSSETVTSTKNPRRDRMVRRVAVTTRAMTVTCSPRGNWVTGVSSPRSM